ncbi:hypothetical protein H0H92_013087 [Tricholoma furcatifolium]|nr:hypothetical protein H0H92_013087 [Tricholoma furcatifolium]
MSDDLIILASPPASPPLRIQWEEPDTFTNPAIDIFDLPNAEADFQLSPTKRSRTYSSSYGRRRLDKRIRTHGSSNNVQSQMVDEIATPNISGSIPSISSSVAEGLNDNYQENSGSPPPIISGQSPIHTSSPMPYDAGSDWSEDGPETFETLLAPSMYSTDAADRYPEDRYPDFVEAALSACLGIYRLTLSVYVVQGWDSRTATATRRWYHVQTQKLGLETVNICLCPNEELDCVHVRFLVQFGQQEFPDNEDLPAGLGPVRLVFRDISEGRHLFSVETPGKPGIKPRAIVQHEGNIDGAGIWRCAKDGGQGCPHVQKARDYLQQLIYQDPTARDKTQLSQALDGDFRCSRCGSVPQEPIFDGVVVAFSKNRILQSLRPPTTPHLDSDVRRSRLLTEKAPIGKAKLRKNLRLIVQGPPLVISGSNDDNDESSGEDESGEETDVSESVEPSKSSEQKTNKDIRKRLSLLPSVHSELSKYLYRTRDSLCRCHLESQCYKSLINEH